MRAQKRIKSLGAEGFVPRQQALDTVSRVAALESFFIAPKHIFNNFPMQKDVALSSHTPRGSAFPDESLLHNDVGPKSPSRWN
jgi:hypothetical protein